MGRMHLIAVVSLVYVCGCLGSLDQELSEGLRRDAEALLAIMTEIEHDPSGALREWGKHANPCLWNGVECSRVAAPRQGLEERVVSLELWGLELEGVIPSQIGKLSQLRELSIVGNKFTGQIPLEIQNCQKLSTLDLRANNLSGSIGFSVADFPALQVLKLSENQLTGTLSGLFANGKGSKIFDLLHLLQNRNSKDVSRKLCPRLEVLDVAHNFLSGKIPTAVGECTQLLEVSLNDNSLTGSIPATFSSLPNLRSLLLNNNCLEGALPSSIAAGCKKLQFLNVADNYFSGYIPVEFAEFEESVHFNFSDNRLEGHIPSGKWKAQQMALAGDFSSNPGLCGWPLAEVCENSHQGSVNDIPLQNHASLFYRSISFFFRLHRSMKRLGMNAVSAHESGRSQLLKVLRTRRSMAESVGPATEPSKKSKSHTARKWLLGLAVGIVAGILAAILLASILRLCFFYMQRAPYLQGPIIFHPNITPKMLVFLENNASLRETDLVGEGGAGRVYKAQLENEMMVAVKRVIVRDDQKGLFGRRQIQAELETLGCIRHRNLVLLLAYVSRPECHLLLYEYMQNGSLQTVFQKQHAGLLQLPWPVRHRIAVGTSNGLSYLHFHCNPRIVHRDLKPSNILLDNNFVAHVADFGLAKVVPGDDTHVTTGVAGTVGFIAPEYSQTCRFTDKSDVYSFGVVLAILLTGRDPTDQFFLTVPGGSIGGWLHDLYQKGEGKDAIDRRLLNGEFEDEILLALKVAVFCTSFNPNERPSSMDVLIMLNQIRSEEP